MDATLADHRAAIRDLLEQYADAVFQHDAEAWGQCWSADGCWHIGDTVVTGRDAITAAWRAAMAAYALVDFRVQLGRVLMTADGAQVRSYTRELLVTASGATRTISGQYDDDLLCSNCEWRFAVRRFRILHDSGTMTAA